MKLEIEDDEKYSDRINGTMPHHIFSYNINTPSINEDSIDFYGHNTISRVDYHRDFCDEDHTKPLMLLNLDNQNKRKAPYYGMNYEDEPPYKKSLFRTNEEEETDPQGWKMKPVVEWERSDTKNWLICKGVELGHSYGHMSPALAMPGKDLLHLTKYDFASCDRLFGERLFDLLHSGCDSTNLPSFDIFKSFSDDETSIGSGNNYSDGDSVNSGELIKKRPPGRPRILDPKKKVVKVKLWEFIRDLLLNPKYCPLWICWDDYSKKRFRFVQSNNVAKLWGARKDNKQMTYEKFSRAMRYYYPKHIFEAVPGRRLVYEFGAKATGLETDNPNFDPNYNQNQMRSRL